LFRGHVGLDSEEIEESSEELLQEVCRSRHLERRLVEFEAMYSYESSTKIFGLATERKVNKSSLLEQHLVALLHKIQEQGRVKFTNRLAALFFLLAILARNLSPQTTNQISLPQQAMILKSFMNIILQGWVPLDSCHFHKIL
jgi:hypothetical protein